MTRDDSRGRDDDDDDKLKKRPFKCCVCRSTKEHRCYKCFCGECPWYTKKIPPRYGVKDCFSDSRPSNSSSVLRRNEETVKLQMDTNAKQLVERSDPCNGDEHPPGFSSNPSELRSSSSVRSGTRENGDEDRYSKAISPNSHVKVDSSSHPSKVKELRGNNKVENQKVVTNEVDCGGSSKSHPGSTSIRDSLAEKQKNGVDCGGSSELLPGSTSIWDLPEKQKHGVDGGGSSKSLPGSTSIWDILAEKQTRASGKQAGWGNTSGSVSSWGPGPVNERRGHSTGSASSWGARRDEERRGNQAEWGNKAGDTPSWGARNVNDRRGNTAGYVSSRGSRREEEPRGNKEVRANRNNDGYSKPVSPIPHTESGSRWTSCSRKRSAKESEKLNQGTDEVGNQKLTEIEVNDGSSKAHAGSTSIWDNLAAKATRASGDLVGWANKVGPGSSWGNWHANEPRGNADWSVPSRDPRRVRELRGNADRSVPSRDPRRVGELRENKEVTANRAQDGSSKLVSLLPHVQTGSGRNSDSRKRSRGDQQRMTNRSEDASFSPVKKPRGNQEIMHSTTKDGSSKSFMLKPNVESGSSRVPCTTKQSKGTKEVRDYRDGDGSCRSVSRHRSSGSSSSWDANIVKDPRGNQEAMASKVKGKPLKQTHNPHKPEIIPLVQSGSNSPPSTIEESRGNREVTVYRAGDGSTDLVLHNHHSERSSSLNSVTVEEPKGNQEIMGYKTEFGTSATFVHDPSAGVVSNSSSLTAKEPAVYSVHGAQSAQDGQHKTTLVSKNIRGVVRENKKIIDPVASPRPAKPPPVVISGESSSIKQKYFDSQKLAQVEESSCPSSLKACGPVKEVIWKGRFEFPSFHGDNRICEGYLAHSAARVNVKAYRFASQIAGNLQLTIHPRRAFWPKIFIDDLPDAKDIALYFYPRRHERSIKEYKELMQLLDEQDLMLRSVMGRVELLVFSSKQLHIGHQKLEGREYYMWGVFRQWESDKVASSTKVVPSPHRGANQATNNST